VERMDFYRNDRNLTALSEFSNCIWRFMSDLVLSGHCEIRVTGDSAAVIGLSSGTDIVIPEKVRFGGKSVPVTSIGSDAFRGTSIRSISIPQSVISVRNWSFASCAALTGVVFLPRSSLLQMGGFTFSDCSSLNHSSFPLDWS
jgi:hypothetical protein